MALRFQPKRLPLADFALDARIRHIEDGMIQLAAAIPPLNSLTHFGGFGNNAAASAKQGTGGGGSVPTVLGGDVTGPVPNNTVSKLQGTTLSLSAVGQGDLITHNGTAFINAQFLTGNYTFTGLTNNAVLVLKPAGATSAGGVLACDDFNNNPLLVVQPRADLDPGFHPVTVDVAGNQTGKSAFRVQTTNSATVGPALFNTLDGSGNTAAQVALQASGAVQFSLADSVAAHLKQTGSLLPVWQVNTDGSQQGGLSLLGFDFNTTTGREFLRGTGNGSAAAIGFLGATPVVRQTGASAAAIAAITDANAKSAVSALQNALNALGLVTAPA